MSDEKHGTSSGKQRRQRASSSDEKRDRRVNVKVNEAEDQQIRHMAAERNMAVSAFITEAALAADDDQLSEEALRARNELPAEEAKLRGISDEINAVARTTNATGEWQPETVELLHQAQAQAAHIEDLCDRISPKTEERVMALIEKSQRLAGHFPSEEALARARRVLRGEITEEEAIAELDRKWKSGPSGGD